MRQREIWIVNLDPTVGSEFKKKRPAVIINGDDIGKLPLKIIAPKKLVKISKLILNIREEIYVRFTN